ncbi:MAG TPA: folylpolyglutamate synthase/dihydrofolate synthase family protein [Chitinispirillaceae bacterium]|nr:folylpolyglutamate synthase/dihydrofolate synthase family protein [Chitinispirillaceae bacterium]
MNASEIKKQLFSLNSKGIKYDLERITEAAKRCGNPHLAYKCFHVAGTNGKGSTCAYLESMLRAHGFRTGLYTSPHILNFEERYQINGKVISEQMWLDVYKDIRHIADDLNLTFFETTTLLAFELFRRLNVQWVVFETGLGGRLDATNIVKPEVSVITRIAFDHMYLLGKDLATIAREKAGIIKGGIPAVVAFNSDLGVREVFKETCLALNAPLIEVSSSDASDVKEIFDGISFLRKEAKFSVKMTGQYQIINALLALQAMEQASLMNEAACVKGLSQTFIPCRFQEIIFKGKKFILDVGHNPDAADVFVKNLKMRFIKKSLCIVTGIMKDKDYQGIIKKYSEIADTIIFSRPDVERASAPEDLIRSVSDATVNKMVCNTIAEAVAAAMDGPHEIICIAGSFFTVGEACKIMGIDPFARL